MNKKRSGSMSASDNSADVSAKNKSRSSLYDFFNAAGTSSIEFIRSICRIFLNASRFIGLEILNVIKNILKLLIHILTLPVDAFKERMKVTRKMQQSLRKAEKKGKKSFFLELIKCAGSFLFGENGVCYTAFNYILPIISAAFLIGVISFGSGLEYGICVEYNGVDLGVIAAESEFDSASNEVQQRIAHSENADMPDFDSKLSVKIISDDEEVLSPGQLADKMLEVSDHELTQAYGVYIDGQLLGAVKDKTPVESALADVLLNYTTDPNAKDIKFQNNVELTEGIYLADTIMSEDSIISTLTSTKQVISDYVVQREESPLIICIKHSMELDSFMSLNPKVGETCTPGQIVKVYKTVNYLPIQYTREVQSISLVDFDTIEVETSSLNLGKKELLVKGQKGERTNNVEVVYVDGIERERHVINSVITKQPVTQQIGIGTYSARPASSDTLLYGTGEFSWPIDGGYISDTFISDRNHKGIDIAAPAGTNIYAAADGVVVTSGWNNGGYGYYVIIDHQNGYKTLYGHCSVLYASEGQTVTRGQLIAGVGTTGNSTGNHCHFEVMYQGMYYDPANFLNTASSFEDDE